MRRMLTGFVAVLALLVVGSAPAATSTVRITKTGFSPSAVTINFGDTVTWHNADTADHQVVADDGSFASPILKSGKDYSFTFKRSGTFRYHDALKSTLRGRITVKGPPPSITLGASIPIVTYGTDVTLSGVVSNKKTGESVTLYAKPYPQASPAQLATILTTTGGAYSYTVKPEIFTTYEAHWRNAVSTSVMLQVAPKVTLGGGRSWYFKTQVGAGAASFAGHFVYLQKLSSLGQWVSIAKLKLGQRSGRIFKYKPARRGLTRIRVFLTVNQAGPGFLSAHSGSQPIRRR
jgi:plastocyanin